MSDSEGSAGERRKEKRKDKKKKKDKKKQKKSKKRSRDTERQVEGTTRSPENDEQQIEESPQPKRTSDHDGKDNRSSSHDNVKKAEGDLK